MVTSVVGYRIQFLSAVNDPLSYLPAPWKQDVIDLVNNYPAVLGDVPTRLLVYDIDVGNTRPIKQHAYRCPPAKREIMQGRVNYLVAHGFAQPSCSPWSWPCVVVPKSDGTQDSAQIFKRREPGLFSEKCKWHQWNYSTIEKESFLPSKLS